MNHGDAPEATVGASITGHHGVAEQLAGDSREREEAYEFLLQLEAEYFNATGGGATSGDEVAEVAVACASPLCAVLCKPASEVDVTEYHRAWQVLTALCGVDPARVGGECCKPDQVNVYSAWMAPDSVLGEMLAKDPATLTSEDALTAGCAWAPLMVAYTTEVGLDAVNQVAGIDQQQWIEMQMPAMFTYLSATPTDDRNLVLCPLLLDLLRAPEKLPTFTLVGVLAALSTGLTGRPAVLAKLLDQDDDPISVLMAILRQAASPSELVSTAGFSRRPHGWAIFAMRDLVETAQASGTDLSAQLLASGFIDVLMSALRAVEEVGTENIAGNVVSWGVVGILSLLNGEALPQVEAKLKLMPTALRFVKDSKITHYSPFGFTAAIFATIVAANVFGKDEDNRFGFAQDDIDGLIVLDTELMRCEAWGALFLISSNRCRGLLSLCISDVAKQMLLSNRGLIPLLIDGLLLDPEHPRNATDETIKTAVQRDFAECIQQISLYPAGAEALKADPALIEALDALVEKAWSDGAKECARGALMQLTERQPKPDMAAAALHGAGSASHRHIMLSYSWEWQPVVRKICAELQRRKYLVWVDFERMQGSIMDAMSEAVEGADLMLYGVSESYKESANCRLELNYGQQEQLDMIPLMMQRQYKPKGWLGLIMGTRLYYAFYESAVDSAEKFCGQMDALQREIGERGRSRSMATALLVDRAAEGVPPTPVLAPAPVPAPAPVAAAPAAAPPSPVATALAPPQSVAGGSDLTPTIQQPSTISMLQQTPDGSSAGTPGGGDFFAMTAFFREERTHMEHKLEQQRKEMEQREQALRAEANAEKAALTAQAEQTLAAVSTKLAAMTAQVEALKEEARRAASRHPLSGVLTEEQLLALQTRAQQLHEAQLLTDEENFTVEDIISDCIEVLATGSFVGDVVVSEVIKIVALSERIPSDMSFARQLRRKCRLSAA